MNMRFCATSLVALWAIRIAAAADLNEELWSAAKKGDAKAVEAIVAKGVDVNAKTNYGVTALFFAVDKGHVEVVKLLLKHKADPNTKDSFYQSTALNWAASKKNAEVVRALIDAGADGAEAVLRSAAVAGRVEMVRAVLASAKVKETTLTAALAATPANRTEIVELLTKAGAQAPATPKTEVTADQKDKRVESPNDPKPTTAPVDDDVSEVTSPRDWPSFRGPNAAGVADGQRPPTVWDVDKGTNIRWKTPIPGLGHSCPVVSGNRVFITSAVSGDPKSEFRPGLYGDVDSVNDPTEHTWIICCVDKQTGKLRWEQTIHRGIPKVKRHLKGSHANCTPATDGRHVVVNLGSEGLYCFARDGKRLWKRDLGDLDSGWFFDADYQWGFGSSPIIHGDLTIVQCDVGKNSFIAAYRLTDGTEAWRTPREEIPSWGTPTIVEGPDRVELVTNATRFARGYDPLTGKELWRLSRHSEITVPTPFIGQGLIFIASGYRPVQPIYAIKPGATGDISLKDGQSSNDAVAWSTSKGGPYMPTPIVYSEYLYVCSNNGIVTCYEAKTGKQIYKERLGGSGGYTASPVAADGKLYFTGEESGIRVVKAGPKFELLAINPMGEVCMATPAISDGMIFVRTQHHVYGIGRTTTAKTSRKD